MGFYVPTFKLDEVAAGVVLVVVGRETPDESGKKNQEHTMSEHEKGGIIEKRSMH